MLELTTWTQSVKDFLKKYGTEAEIYLRSRGVTEEEQDKFDIGFIKRFQRIDGDSIDSILWNKTFCSSRFESNRLIFPIHNLSDKVNSIVTRPFSHKHYINFFPEKAVDFGILWGWKQAEEHIYKSGKVVIVEGIFDLLSIQKFIPNSLAVLTRTFTDGQLNKISFFADHITLAFDNDVHGERANAIWGKELQKRGFNVGNIKYGYHDPNDWFMKDPVGMSKTLSKIFQ